MKKLIVLSLFAVACAESTEAEPAPSCRWIPIAAEGYPSEPYGKPCVRIEARGSGVVREAGGDAETEAVEVLGTGRGAEVLVCDGQSAEIRVRSCRGQ
jgi:hypothetical protein